MSYDVRNNAGDPYALAGVWSPPTSDLNFCEEDYAITKYIAEFINCLTNLSYIYFSIRYSRPNFRRADLMSAALILVGACSFVYHGTLRLKAQFADDSSMLVLAGALLQRLYCTSTSKAVNYQLTTAIFVAVFGMCVYHIRSGVGLLHAFMFAGMLTLIWPRTLYLIFTQSRSTEKKNARLRKFGRAVATLVFAFGLWNIDLRYCPQLRELRAAIGLPWAWILELHGWWHLLTALGAAEYMELIRDLCP